ncbi:MAG: glycosyltransferase [Bacteroidetes bacterium]|nr:glycosyltransferase [Bacteroidota bacterium]
MTPKHEGVAFLIIGIPDLSGSGGAERFFADFFEIYNDQQSPKRKLIFLTDDTSNLTKIGKFKKHVSSIFSLRVNRKNQLTDMQWRYPSLKNAFLFLNELPLCLSIINILRKQNIKILHIPLYEDKDYYLFKLIDSFPFFRPKLVLNIVDCRIPYYYFKNEPEYSYASAKNYSRLFNTIKIDAVYSWYEAFKEFTSKNNIVKSQPPVTVIKSRFTSAKLISDQQLLNKKNSIVFAGRLDIQKNPLFFLEAINLVAKEIPGLRNWKVEMYGKGELEGEIIRFIKEHQLTELVSLSFTSDLTSVFADSKCYISTQEFENFPSLAMAEAMANGNMIISRNVGQTYYFVRDGVNGFLSQTDTPKGLADCIIKMLHLNNEEILRMGRAGISILKEEHNSDNFIKQTDDFWDSVK